MAVSQTEENFTLKRLFCVWVMPWGTLSRSFLPQQGWAKLSFPGSSKSSLQLISLHLRYSSQLPVYWRLLLLVSNPNAMHGTVGSVYEVQMAPISALPYPLRPTMHKSLAPSACYFYQRLGHFNSLGDGREIHLKQQGVCQKHKTFNWQEDQCLIILLARCCRKKCLLHFVLLLRRRTGYSKAQCIRQEILIPYFAVFYREREWWKGHTLANLNIILFGLESLVVIPVLACLL